MRRTAFAFILALFALPAEGEVRLLIFDNFDCIHGRAMEAVAKGYAKPGVTVERVPVELAPIGCGEYDGASIGEALDDLVADYQSRPQPPTVVYFGFGNYEYPDLWRSQLRTLRRRGVILVGGAGNRPGDACKRWPGAMVILASMAWGGKPEPNTGSGPCVDLYVDFDGGVTVVLDGTYWTVGATSTASVITAAVAANYLTSFPAAKFAEVEQAFNLGRVLTDEALAARPSIGQARAVQSAGKVQVTGMPLGPVPAVALYRGLPKDGKCQGKPLVTAPVGAQGFSGTMPARGANVCIEPRPYGQALGIRVE